MAGDEEELPGELRRQYEQIAARAAALGRPLDPMPALELAGHRRHGSRTVITGTVSSSGPARPARVRLALELLDTDPAERPFDTQAGRLWTTTALGAGVRPTGWAAVRAGEGTTLPGSSCGSPDAGSEGRRPGRRPPTERLPSCAGADSRRRSAGRAGPGGPWRTAFGRLIQLGPDCGRRLRRGGWGVGRRVVPV